MDRREKFSENLHPLYLIKYKALCQILSPRWQPVSGFRPIAEQAALFRLGRSEKSHVLCKCDKQPCDVHPLGLPVTKARPGLSMHNYGIATDWGFFEGSKYIQLPFEDPRWLEYASACINVGLRRVTWERPHNELDLPVHINVVYDAFLDGSLAGAKQCISEVMS